MGVGIMARSVSKSISATPRGALRWACLLLLGCISGWASAHPGGIIQTEMGVPGTGGKAVWVQPDGKVLVAGTANGFDANHFGLLRYHADGSLDTSFGAAGRVSTVFPDVWASVNDMAVQADGKIVVVGDVYSKMALARYLPNGALDSSFGDNGLVVSDYASGKESALSLALRADGKILVVGYVGYVGAGGDDTALDTLVAQYNTDGSPDNAFGYKGRTVYAFSALRDFANALVLQPDGKILIGGLSESTTTASPEDFLLARFNSDGSLDNTFGALQQGFVKTSMSNYDDRIVDVALQSDGKIVVVGQVQDTPTHYASMLARYTTAGVLDLGFATSGKKMLSNGSGEFALAEHLLIQAGDKIVVGYHGGFALSRHSANGVNDSSFGTGGLVSATAVSPFSGYGLAEDASGRLLMTGRYGYKSTMATARFNTNGSLDNTFGPRIDLSVRVNGYGTAVVGEQSNYQVVVDNFGWDTVGNVVLRDVLPTDATLVSVSASQGSCTGTTTLLCNLGAMASEDQVTVDVVWLPNAAGVGMHVISIDAVPGDTNSYNDALSYWLQSYENPAVNLSLSMTPSPAAIIAGNNVVYTLTVTNIGSAAVNSVSINPALLSGPVLLLSAPDCTIGWQAGLHCAVGTLAPGESRSVMVTLNVAATFSYKATANGLETDLNPANNNASATVHVDPGVLDLAATAVSSTTTAIGKGKSLSVLNTACSQASAGAGSTVELQLAPLDTSKPTIVLGSRSFSYLLPGTCTSENTLVTLPNTAVAGTYTLRAVVDPRGLLTESNKTNNSVSGAPITVRDYADLVAVQLVPATLQVAIGHTAFSLQNTVSNIGTATATAVAVKFYLSADDVIDATDKLLVSRTISSLAPGLSSVANTLVKIDIKTLPGTWYFGMMVDPANAIVEDSDSNNTLASAAVTAFRDVDLSVNSVATNLSSVPLSGMVTVTTTVANLGTQIKSTAVPISIYLSTDAQISSSDRLLGRGSVPAMLPGTIINVPVSVKVPLTTPIGPYYVGVLIDPTNVLPESNEGNNSKAGPMVQAVLPDVDLVMVGTYPEDTLVLAKGSSISVTNTVQNLGTMNMGIGVSVRFYLSADRVFSITDKQVVSRSVPILTAGALSSVLTTVVIPTGTLAGTYYLGAIVDPTNVQPETDNANNAIFMHTVTVLP